MRNTYLSVVMLPFLYTPAIADPFPNLPDHFTSVIQGENLDEGGLGIAAEDARLLMALAIDLIKEFEQWRASPYNDAASFCTIGYGHLIVKKTCENASEELKKIEIPLEVSKGLSILDEDTKLARTAVQTHVKVQLTDEQFGALTSFVFNVGSRAFANSTLLKYVNNEEFEGVPNQLKRWVIAGGQVSNGLIARRACEAALFTASISYRSDNRLYREDCQSLGAADGTEAPIDILVGESP